ncbi:MAG: hypothetical protein WA989_13320 [Henriciella sp.]|uniref:hypothetical protein n=1 Tax=Henriciella sp. TaxID=1968823 RepID=UPI003C776CF5
MAEFKHYSIVAGGELVEGHDVPDGEAGPAVVSAKVWAPTVEQAVDVFCEVGNQIGFSINDKVEVHLTPAKQAKQGVPFGYDVRVRSCSGENFEPTLKDEIEHIRNE